MNHQPLQAGVIDIKQRDIRLPNELLHNDSPTTTGWDDGHKVEGHKTTQGVITQ